MQVRRVGTSVFLLLVLAGVPSYFRIFLFYVDKVVWQSCRFNTRPGPIVIKSRLHIKKAVCLFQDIGVTGGAAASTVILLLLRIKKGSVFKM